MDYSQDVPEITVIWGGFIHFADAIIIDEIMVDKYYDRKIQDYFAGDPHANYVSPEMKAQFYGESLNEVYWDKVADTKSTDK